MGFWVFGSKIKNTGFSPPFAPFAANHTPGPSAGARARFFAAQNPGKLLCNHQVCCCFASLSDPRAVFFCRRWTCRSSRSFAVGQAPRTARGGGAGPPVRLLSLTSFSAGDLVPRPCMSSSYGCASCRLCLLRDRVFECRAHLLSSAPRLAPLIPAGPSVSKELRRYGTARTR